MNNPSNRIHYRIKSKKPSNDTSAKGIVPFAVCALGASIVTAGVIASCSLKKKYICCR